MKQGYSIIELMVGIFLASLLAISLFQSVRNTTITAEIADDIMDLDMRVANFHHQFERDTIGIFMPDKFEITQTQEKPQAPNALDKAKPSPTPPTQQANEKNMLDAQAKAQKLPDKLFYSVNGDTGQVTEFTFITTNPVSVYEKAANITVKPRMVRVMYRLIVDPNKEDSFSLFRQESEELDAAALEKKAAKPVRGYALLTSIKKMTLDFSYPVKKEESKEQPKEGLPALGSLPPAKTSAAADQAKPATPEVQKIESRKDWPFKTSQEAQEKRVPPMPQIITAKFELWDATGKSFREFTLNYPIASFTLEEKKKKKKLPPKPMLPNAQTTNQTTKRAELQLTFKPKTEQKLKELGEQVFKITLPDVDFKALTNKSFLTSKKETKVVKGKHNE
ncbi:MAG: hypothetical protein AB7F19_02965 [Candidatus Babeliales bacterium]